MTKLRVIGKTEIRVFGRDRRPAHSHLVTPDGDAMISLETLTLLREKISARTLDTALEWAKDNRALIVTEWNRLNPTMKVSADE